MIIRRAEAHEKQICYDIRRVVFIEGQNVPPERERDAYDENALHFLAFKGEEALATARVVLQDEGQICKIERVAVLEKARGLGIGKLIMQAIENAPELKGAAFLKLDSQTHALPFYERLGYAAFGEEFMDAGIPHFHMKKPGGCVP